MMLVKTSIIKPLTDGQAPLNFKQTPISTQKAKKLAKPKMILTGYSIGYLETSLNAHMEIQFRAQVNPNAPTADRDTDNAEVFIVKLVFTVFENTMQNSAVMTKEIPKNIRHTSNSRTSYVSFINSIKCPAISKATPIIRVNKEKCFNLIITTAFGVIITYPEKNENPKTEVSGYSSVNKQSQNSNSLYHGIAERK